MEVSKEINNDDPEKAIDFRFMVDGSVPLPQRIVEYAVNRPIASQRQAHVRMITAALDMITLEELTKILEIMVEITKDVEPESRLSLAKQLPIIVQKTLKLAPSVDEACALICEHVHPAMESLVKDEGDDIGQAAVVSFVKVLKLTVHETTYDVWDILERCVHSNREDVRCRAAGLLAGSVAHLTSSALATTKRKATASVLKRGSFAVPLAGGESSRRRGRALGGGGVPAMPAFAEEGEGGGDSDTDGKGGDSADNDTSAAGHEDEGVNAGDSSENEDIVPPLLSEIGRSIKRGTLAPGASAGAPGGAAPHSGKRDSITAGATPDDLPEVIRLDFLGQAAQFYMTLLNDMDPGVQAAALAPSVANRMMTMILLMRGGDSMDTLPFVPEDDPPEYDDGYPPYVEVDEEDWSPDEDEDALQLQLAWLRNLESLVEVEKACMVSADAEAGGGQSFTSVLVDEDALSDFEDEWVEGGSDLDFCDGLEEGAEPALDEYFQDAWCDVAREERGEVALTRALRRLAAEESPRVRAAVAQAVPAVADSMPDSIRRRQLRHLLVRLACDEHSDVRVAAAAAAGRMITAFAVEASLASDSSAGAGPEELKGVQGAIVAVGGSSRLSDSEAARLTFAEAAQRCGIPLSLLAVYILATQGLRCDRRRISTVISAAVAFTRLGGRQRLLAAQGAVAPAGAASPTASSSSTSATSSDSEEDSEASSADSDGGTSADSDEEFRSRSRSSTLRGRNRQEAEEHAERNAAAVREASRKASVGSRAGEGEEGETDADYELFEHHDKLQHSAAYTLPALVLSLGPGRWSDLLCPWSPPGGVRLTPTAPDLPADLAELTLPRVSPLSLATATAGVMKPTGQHLAVTATSLAGLHEAVRETRYAPAALRPLTAFLRCTLATERFRWPTAQQVALEVLPRVLQWTQHATHVSLTGSLYPMSLPVRCGVWRTRWKLACQVPALALVMSPRAAMSRLLPLCNVLLRDPVSVVRRDAAKAAAVLLSRLAAVAASAQAVVDAAAASRNTEQGEGLPQGAGSSPGRRLNRSPAPLSLHLRRQSVGSIPPALEAQARDLANTLSSAVQRTAQQLHSLAAAESHLDHKGGFVKLCQYLCYPRALRSIVEGAMGTLAYQHSNLPNTMVLLTSPAPGTPGGSAASPGTHGARVFPGSPVPLAGGGSMVVATPPAALLSPSVPKAPSALDMEADTTKTALRTPVRAARASVASNVLSTDQQFLVEWEGLSLSLGIPCPALGLTDALEGREQNAVNTTLSVAGWLLGAGDAATGGAAAPSLGGVGGSASPAPGSTEAGLMQNSIMSPALTHPDASAPSTPGGEGGGVPSSDAWSSSVSRDSKAGIACISRPESAVWSRRSVIMQAVGAVSKRVFQEHFCGALGDMLTECRVRQGGYLWRQALELLPAQSQAATSAAVAARTGEAENADGTPPATPSEAEPPSAATPDAAASVNSEAKPAAPLDIPSIAVQVTPAHGGTASSASIEGLLQNTKEEHINARVPMVAPDITPPSASPVVSPASSKSAAVTPSTAALKTVDVAARASMFGGTRKGSTGSRRTSHSNVVSLVSPRVTRSGPSRRTSGRAGGPTAGGSGKAGALQTPDAYLSSARNRLRSVDKKVVAAGRIGGRLAAAAQRAKDATAQQSGGTASGARRDSAKAPSGHRRTGTDVDVMTSLTFDPGAMADDEAAMDALVNRVIAQNEEADEMEGGEEPEQEHDESEHTEAPRAHRRSHSLSGPTRKRTSLIDEAPTPAPTPAPSTGGAQRTPGKLASIDEAGSNRDTSPEQGAGASTGIAALDFWKSKDKKRGAADAGTPPSLPPARRPSSSAGSVLKLVGLQKQLQAEAAKAEQGGASPEHTGGAQKTSPPDAVKRARRATAQPNSGAVSLGAVSSKIKAWQSSSGGGSSAGGGAKGKLRGKTKKASGTNLAHHKYLAMLQASTEEFSEQNTEQPAAGAGGEVGAEGGEAPAAPPKRPPSAPAAPPRAPPSKLSSVTEESASDDVASGAAASSGSGASDGKASEGGEGGGLRHKRRSLGALSFMQNRERAISEAAPVEGGGSSSGPSSRRASRTGSRRNSYAAPQAGDGVRPFSKSVPYAELSLAQPGSELVLDWSSKEQYLSDDEFRNVLGCTKAEFEGLPRWKQQRMKRDVSLF